MTSKAVYIYVFCLFHSELLVVKIDHIYARGNYNQRWSPRGRSWPRGHPRGHILKSLALASKIKSLASRLQVLKNWPVLGSRTGLFFELLKFLERLKNFLENFFLWRSLEKFL